MFCEFFSEFFFLRELLGNHLCVNKKVILAIIRRIKLLLLDITRVFKVSCYQVGFLEYFQGCPNTHFDGPCDNQLE